MNEEEIKEFAEKEGYTELEYQGIWKGFDVYYAWFGEKDCIYHTGLPFYVLVKGNKIRLSRPDECLIILRYFNFVIANIKGYI